MRWPVLITLYLIFALLTCTPVRAVVTSDDPDRHVVTPGEPAYGVNLDGVVLLGGDVPGSTTASDLIALCSGALVSDRHILSAAHCFDSDFDGRVDFLIDAFPFAAAFELQSGTVIAEVDTASIRFPSAWPEESLDLAIMELAEDAPPGVPRYPLYGGADEVGREIVVVGFGSSGQGKAGATNASGVKRAGRNRYELIENGTLLAYDFDSGLETNNTLAHLGHTSDLGLGLDEVSAAPGDSGAPVFLAGAIAGVVSYGDRIQATDFTDVYDSSWGEIGFDTRVSAYRDFLVTETGRAVVFVPEPSTGVLLAFGVLFFVGRRLLSPISTIPHSFIR